MKQRTSETPPEAGSARRRLLETATRLFYEGGIHAVGIDRIIAEAGVAKATFYNHFPSKDDLVVAYLQEIDRLGRAAVASLHKQPPRKMILAIMGRISEAVTAGGWRGCPFLNAAAEYPDPASPVRQAINARRVWYHNSLENLLIEDGDPAPSVTASLLVALSDGLLESAYLDDTESVPALVCEAVTRLLDRR
ncbi:TetR/AcrR family transcriptional regulator [Neorhizobium petrolearium]|uniref:TetR/AcrR family transcriptional regulator n=1 Tax=Neorhizobium petrolearium TaxID=515361 RepID=A0ABY8M8T5_9HYPH|nr:TetR/AcrR family transcriptional regulator [Neorhizobium petrolearium]MCC2610858.1 TetR/AcrR family transcriptional regulator [Neorhizobium petrolearium]WGI70973.1 TetR/AcrR family transcriptional regulator [Neorhizobium petrolearium]